MLINKYKIKVGSLNNAISNHKMAVLQVYLNVCLLQRTNSPSGRGTEIFKENWCYTSNFRATWSVVWLNSRHRPDLVEEMNIYMLRFNLKY